MTFIFSTPAFPRHASIESKTLQRETEQLLADEKWFYAREALRELALSANADMESHYRIKDIEITLLRLNYTIDGFQLVKQYAEQYWNNYHILHQILQVLYSRKSITDHLQPHQRLAAATPIAERILQLVNERGEKFANDRAFTYTPALAQFYFESGDKKKAIEMTELGIQSLKSLPPTLRMVILPAFLNLLADYQDKKVCMDGVCGEPPKRWKARYDCEIKLFSRP